MAMQYTALSKMDKLKPILSVSFAPLTMTSLSPSNINGWRAIPMILENDTSSVLISIAITIEYNLAKSALIESIQENSYISSDFPFEIVRVRAGSKKLTGPLRPFVTSHHSRRVAREVFGYGIRGKKLVSEECFDLIFWEIIPKALKEFPSSFKDWLSKHVTGCCGVNRFLSKWEPAALLSSTKWWTNLEVGSRITTLPQTLLK
jgi:hypothetical protein